MRIEVDGFDMRKAAKQGIPRRRTKVRRKEEMPRNKRALGTGLPTVEILLYSHRRTYSSIRIKIPKISDKKGRHIVKRRRACYQFEARKPHQTK